MKHAKPGICYSRSRREDTFHGNSCNFSAFYFVLIRLSLVISLFHGSQRMTGLEGWGPVHLSSSTALTQAGREAGSSSCPYMTCFVSRGHKPADLFLLFLTTSKDSTVERVLFILLCWEILLPMEFHDQFIELEPKGRPRSHKVVAEASLDDDLPWSSLMVIIPWGRPSLQTAKLLLNFDAYNLKSCCWREADLCV